MREKWLDFSGRERKSQLRLILVMKISDFGVDEENLSKVSPLNLLEIVYLNSGKNLVFKVDCEF
jgi:hypothetical protein